MSLSLKFLILTLLLNTFPHNFSSKIPYDFLLHFRLEIAQNEEEKVAFEMYLNDWWLKMRKGKWYWADLAAFDIWSSAKWDWINFALFCGFPNFNFVSSFSIFQNSNFVCSFSIFCRLPITGAQSTRSTENYLLHKIRQKEIKVFQKA